MQTEEVNLNDLGLMDDGDPEVDLTTLPKERSAPRELPQPGTMRLRLPGNIMESIKPISSPNGQRLQLQLRDDCALIDVKSGLPVNYNISTLETAVYNKGAVTGFTHEVARLLKALGYEGPLSSKADQVKAIQSVAGREFLVDIGYETACNPKREIYKDRAKQPQLGCGQKYRMKAENYKKKDGTPVEIYAIPREATGAYKQKFQCLTAGCGAELGVFLRFSNYRAAK